MTAPRAPTPEEYEQAREAARRQLSTYGLLVEPTPGWSPYAFHLRLCRALEWVARTPEARLIVEAPPRLGKTVASGWLLPTWYLGLHPEQEVIAGTYATQRAEDIGRRVRQIVSSGKYRALFPEARALEQYRAATRIDLAAGGSYRGVSIDGIVTGRGADLLLIDDPVKNAEQARSALWQATLREAWQFVFRPRLKAGGKIVVSMARWSADDFVGWLRAEHDEGWRVLSFPMLGEDGEPLCPALFDRAACEAIRRDVGERAWRALYQQDPAPDDVAVFQRSWWSFYGGPRDAELPTAFDRVIEFWDCKLKDLATSGSFVCGQKWGRSGGKLYLLDRVRGRWSFADSLREMVAMRERAPRAEALCIEDAAAGPVAVQVLRRKFPNVIAVPARGSKLARAEAIAPMVESGACHLPRVAWTDEFIEECAGFPSAAHDDQVDAMAHALALLATDRAAGAQPDPETLSRILDGLVQDSWSTR